MSAVAQPLTELAHELLQKRTDYPAGDDDARGSTLVIGGVTGAGASFNVVLGSAWFSVDRRFNPEENLDEELARLTNAITTTAEQIGAKVSIDVLQRQPSGTTNQDHPAARKLARCITEIQGQAPQFELCPGALDTRWYSQLGIPAFGYRAGRPDVSQGPHEYIEQAAMRRCAAGYACFAGEMLQ